MGSPLKEAADRALELLEQMTPMLLAIELDKATRALTRAGFTYTEGAQEWKPPIGPSASPLLDRIYLLGELLAQASTQLQTVFERDPQYWDFHGLVSRIDTALVGNLRERSDTEWTDGASTPTAEDYRELQAQHDQLQSRLRAALDMLREARISVEFRHSTTTNFGGTVTTGRLLEKIDALLAGQVPAPAVPEGWQPVPAEPTEEMIIAAVRNQKIKYASWQVYVGVYRAMLAAAPKPEGGEV